VERSANEELAEFRSKLIGHRQSEENRCLSSSRPMPLDKRGTFIICSSKCLRGPNGHLDLSRPQVQLQIWTFTFPRPRLPLQIRTFTFLAHNLRSKSICPSPDHTCGSESVPLPLPAKITAPNPRLCLPRATLPLQIRTVNSTSTMAAQNQPATSEPIRIAVVRGDLAMDSGRRYCEGHCQGIVGGIS
jgi:hypothetical protein